MVGTSQMWVMYMRRRDIMMTKVQPYRPVSFQLFARFPRRHVKPVVTRASCPCSRLFGLVAIWVDMKFQMLPGRSHQFSSKQSMFLNEQGVIVIQNQHRKTGLMQDLLSNPQRCTSHAVTSLPHCDVLDTRQHTRSMNSEPEEFVNHAY